MPEPSKSTPIRRARRRASPQHTSPHQDITALTGAVRDLAGALKPLEALAEHVPALVEMASAWNAGKTGGRAVWRMGEVTAALTKWITPIIAAAALVFLLWRGKWDLIVKAMGS